MFNTAFQSFYWLDSFLQEFIHISSEQIIAIMIIPILIDSPRTFGKTIFLVLYLILEKFRKRPCDYYQPQVSIIVPAHNEEKIIEHSILSLLELDYPNKEIIIVDDGSTDRTKVIATRYVQEGGIKLLHRDVASGKKARAVNYGLMHVKGEIIITVDADTLLERSSLRNIIHHFNDPNVGAVSGNVKVLNQVNLLTKLQAYEYLISMEMGRRFQAAIRTLMIIPGAFGAIRKRVLSSIGVFDPDTLTEDFDVTIKLHKTRFKIKFAADAICWTQVPETWREWIRQRTRWTSGQLQTLHKHKNLFFESGFGLVGILGAPDMLFMDIILLFLRTAWLIVLPLFYFNLIPQLFLLIFLFYMFNELPVIIAAALFSPRKEELKYIFLVPIMVILYRPLYGLIRLKAYLNTLSGSNTAW